MAIGTAVQRGSTIAIYNEHGHQTGSVFGGDLQGYTSGTVSVQRGIMIHTFDERGRQLSTTFAGSAQSSSSSSGSSSRGASNSSSARPNPLLVGILVLFAVIGSATGLIKPSSQPDAYQQEEQAPAAAPPPNVPAAESSTEPQPVEPQVMWGAFAVSPSTGSSSWSKGYNSETEAQQAAIQSCGQSDCSAFSFTAGAAALVESDTHWYHEAGRASEEEARQLALEQCQAQEPAGNCRLVTALSF